MEDLGDPRTHLLVMTMAINSGIPKRRETYQDLWLLWLGEDLDKLNLSQEEREKFNQITDFIRKSRQSGDWDNLAGYLETLAAKKDLAFKEGITDSDIHVYFHPVERYVRESDKE